MCLLLYHLEHKLIPKSQGPVVRITPNEVHFLDPDFIDTVYPGPGRKTNKPLWFAHRTGSKSNTSPWVECTELSC